MQGAFDNSEEQRLERKLQESQALAAQASRLERENARLRELLKGQRSAYEYGPLAQVVAPVGDQFTQRIVINVGTEDGVEPNRPVVIGENTLVGRTTEVSKHTAQVMLITDQMFAAGVRIIPPAEFDPASGELSPAVTAENVSYGQGFWKPTQGYSGSTLSLKRAEEGDFVVTSGRAGDKELLFPPGLYVGKVEAVSSQDIEQFKKIVVDPAMNPQDLEEVRVIVDWAGRGGRRLGGAGLRHPRRDRRCDRSAARRRRGTLPDLRLLLTRLTLIAIVFAVAPLRDLQAVLLGFFGGILLDALGSDLFGSGR